MYVFSTVRRGSGPSKEANPTRNPHIKHEGRCGFCVVFPVNVGLPSVESLNKPSENFVTQKNRPSPSGISVVYGVQIIEAGNSKTLTAPNLATPSSEVQGIAVCVLSVFKDVFSPSKN